VKKDMLYSPLAAIIAVLPPLQYYLFSFVRSSNMRGKTALSAQDFYPAEIHQMQTDITETINRMAGFLTPYETSCPSYLCGAHRRHRAQDRAYAVALIHGVFADAHHDPRVAGWQSIRLMIFTGDQSLGVSAKTCTA